MDKNTQKIIDELIDEVINTQDEKTEKLEQYNETIINGLDGVMLDIEDYAREEPITRNTNKKAHYILSLLLEMFNDKAQKEQTDRKIWQMSEIIVDADGANKIYYLGYLGGLINALNGEMYQNVFNEVAEDVIKDIGSYFYTLEDIPELKEFYKDKG